MKYVEGSNAISRKDLSQSKEIIPLLQAYLFTHEGYVSKERLYKLFGEDKERLEKAIRYLKIIAKENIYSGIAVYEKDDSISLSVKDELKNKLVEFEKQTLDRRLSLIEEYLYVMESRNNSPRTIQTYRYTLTDFAKNIGRPLRQIKSKDIRQYLMEQKRKGNNQKTISNKISKLKSFFKWLEIEEYIEKNPMRKIQKPKTKEAKPKPLSQEEIIKLRKVAVKLIDKALLEVFYSSGIRVSECHNLNWEDINFHEKSLQVIGGKGDKDRITYLSTEAVVALKEYKQSRKDNNIWIFQSNYKQRMSRYSINRRIRNLGNKAELKKKVYPHRLRHTFASHLHRAGVELEHIQRLLGHSDPKTTQIYAEINKNKVKDSHHNLFQ